MDFVNTPLPCIFLLTCYFIGIFNMEKEREQGIMKEQQERYQGLSSAEVQANRERDGWNLLEPPVRPPWWKQFLGKFDDPVIRILMIAALIALCTGEILEGGGILIAIFLATALAFLNEFRAEKEFDILNKVNDDVPVKVIRDSEFHMIPKKEIVTGDILFIELGEEIPADGHILESVNLQVDQSRLTGESDPVRKISTAEAENLPPHTETYPPDQLLRGTPVVDGYGYMEVTAIGAKTEIGKTAVAASEDSGEKTPLNIQLERLGKLIGVIGFSMAGITFAALVLRGVLHGTLAQNDIQWILSGILFLAVLTALVRVWLPVVYDGIGFWRKTLTQPLWLTRAGFRGWPLMILTGTVIALAGVGILAAMGKLPPSVHEWIGPKALPLFIQFFMIAVTLVVVAVPEGLAMSVTLSLAYSMRKMTAANNLVRRMHACETIGAATVICTDKTGTLTMNRMRVHEMEFPSSFRDSFFLGIAANSTANLSAPEEGSDEPLPVGNPTEGALLLYLKKNALDYDRLRHSFRITKQWTFSTERKFMATRGFPENAGQEILFAKGAPEILLKRCGSLRTAGGILPLDESGRSAILARLLEYQGRGMRTLGFASLENPGTEEDLSILATGMVWDGFAAIADPVRPDVPDAVAACRRAGIQVKMVTGDNPETAREIGRGIHLWEEDSQDKYQIITGAEFAALSDAEALIAADRIRIMARARPNDKLRLVRCLKTNGEVVAVTGDGTNDAPALNYADVGISMGKTGTSIAKEASDIILLDDSFPSIVNAVLWGRSLYRNIQKFILFQLTVNAVALTIAMLGPFLGIELPLTVIQMLWINLIMDTFAALALATDPPDPAVMNLPPRRNTAFIVTPAMWIGIVSGAVVFLAVLCTLLLWMRKNGLEADSRYLTIFFCVLVMMQFWNLFNAKCWGSADPVFKHLSGNRMFLLIAFGILILQILIVQFGGKIFRCIPLGLSDWLWIIGGTSLILWGGEILRTIGRIRARRKENGK